MKCYQCGQKVSVAFRMWAEPKDNRYKVALRDFCEPCHDAIMHNRGYVRTGNMRWKPVKEPTPKGEK